MTDKDLFDVLDPETWPDRPLQKIFHLNNFDIEKSTREEIRQVLFAKFKEWAGKHLDKIDTMVVERCFDYQGDKEIPSIQIRFTLKKQG